MTAGLVHAAPITLDGSVYDLTLIAQNGNDLSVRYTIDTTGYTGAGSYIDTVSIKIINHVLSATLTDFTIDGVSGPVGDWTVVAGGQNSKGCSPGTGSGFVCAQDGTDAPVGGVYSWTFDILAAVAFEFTSPASIKADYVDFADGIRRFRNQISENISLSPPGPPPNPVPEPSSLILLATGAAGLIGARRARAARRTRSRDAGHAGRLR